MKIKVKQSTYEQVIAKKRAKHKNPCAPTEFCNW